MLISVKCTQGNKLQSTFKMLLSRKCVENIVCKISAIFVLVQCDMGYIKQQTASQHRTISGWCVLVLFIVLTWKGSASTQTWYHENVTNISRICLNVIIIVYYAMYLQWWPMDLKQPKSFMSCCVFSLLIYSFFNLSQFLYERFLQILFSSTAKWIIMANYFKTAACSVPSHYSQHG